MGLDLSTLPVDKIKDLVAMATKQKPFTFKAASKDLLSILDWATNMLGDSEPAPAPIGAGSDPDAADLEAINALLAGEVTSDDAVGFGGVLISVAVSALLRQALKLLLNNI